MTDVANWTGFDLVDTGHLPQNGLFGAAFDGRFVYFACANGGPTTRYDTQAPFGDAASWTTHQTSQDLEGALFDGQRVYFVPSISGTALRYAPAGGFGDAGAWESFSTTSIDANARSFTGGVFDGRYVYYFPNNATGTMARFDTQKTFIDPGAWTSFAVATTINASLTSLHGGVFDGRYLYSADYSSALVARYDTQGTLSDPMSWKTFATRGKDASITGLYAAGFDGRYVYFAPNSYAATSVLARYDIQGAFDDGGSWSTFDITTVSPGQILHYVTAFDGRYLYVVPSQGHLITRYDTRAPFADKGSWTSFDLTKKTTSSTDYGGAVFDGRYLYLEPILSGTHVVVLRFDAKSPPALPSLPQFRGSFY
jgi:hypothetical protein